MYESYLMDYVGNFMISIFFFFYRISSTIKNKNNIYNSDYKTLDVYKLL